MKILIVADEEARALWDFYDPARLEGVELILSAGDLDRRYLDFLVTMTNLPLLYVRGNHDTEYLEHPPEGCVCIEDKVAVYKGIRILGLGGSLKYKDSSCMYTEGQMSRRILRALAMTGLSGGLDILLTHAPARGWGDMDDLPHRGFACFNRFLERRKPAYMIHGHVHRTYTWDFKRETIHPSGTRIINGFGWTILEIEDKEQKKTGRFLPGTIRVR